MACHGEVTCSARPLAPCPVRTPTCEMCQAVIKTLILATDPDGIAQASAILEQDGLVAMPTETVYGLAGNARSDVAIEKIFSAKERPRFNPLIVHVPDLEMAQTIGVFDQRALALARAFWPGPLTMVLPLQARAELSGMVTANLNTVAIRVPAHPVAQALLRQFRGPLAAPSANPSGKVSPTTAAHVLAGLGGRIDAVIDGGPCEVGVESTIVGLDGSARLLRPGGLPVEAIAAILGTDLLAAEAKITAPGQLHSHYAPNARVRLNVAAPAKDEVWVGFGPDCGGADLNLSPSGNLSEAAAALFETLRQADILAGSEGVIVFAPIPERGLGQAINDRLRRAAAPRE
jgi:L-threonylcarbamoyladenylate synthase